MAYSEMKTLHLKLTPTADGFLAQHKKYNNAYGAVRSAPGNPVRIASDIADDALRAEAVSTVVDAVFRETDAGSVAAENAVTAREAWRAAQTERFAALYKTAADYAEVLGKPVHCVMDRPLGTCHPRHPDMLYPINYGFVPGVLGGDGAEQDVYILGPTVPLETFDGVVAAVVHRFDDCEDKWIVTAPDAAYTAEEMRAAVEFQERFYASELIRCTRI